MTCMEHYRRWLDRAGENAALAEELRSIETDPIAIEDRFYRELEFGTGGLRGILGAGTNRMNVYTVAKATQGYANYLLRTCSAPSVAIAYDSRVNSTLFAQTAAAVFAANAVAVRLYPRLMPTPALSFAVRELGCSGGIVVTASHNPADYNGYKVYGADGCQITTAAANAIQDEINAVDCFDGVKAASFDAALAQGLVSYISEDTVDRYLQAVSTASVLPGEIPRDVSIVYTPLNGAGISCVPRCLQAHGFTHLTIPEEQRDPDGSFPTCPFPNPEVREALEVGLAWAERTGSDLLLATDPDCDRVGCAVRDGGGYTLISGNEMGVLLLDFICKLRTQQGTMPANPVAVKTIVTTPMAEKIAAHYGVELRNVLTGFKFIGEQIGLLEQAGEAQRYIFGFEESYGYLSGSFVRDKDAVNAALLICELFAYYKAQGKTLVQVLDGLYETYGCYRAALLSFTFAGSAGFARMGQLLDSLRQTPPAALGGRAVTGCEDYLKPHAGLPASNVLRYALDGGAEAVVRPSGTEPKLKVYLTAAEPTRQESDALLDRLSAHFHAWAGEKA